MAEPLGSTLFVIGGMGVSIAIDVIVLAVLVYRQVRARPLSTGYVLPLLLVVFGLLEFGAVLLGSSQALAQFLKGQQSFSAIPDGGLVVAALAGSLGIAVISAAVRAPTYRLWWQDGRYWRQGTAITLLLWLISLGAHLLYDGVIARNSALSALGSDTILLYFGVTLAVQRWLLGVRASNMAQGSGRSGRTPMEGAR
jgi:hypothetical protein